MSGRSWCPVEVEICLATSNGSLERELVRSKLLIIDVHSGRQVHTRTRLQLLRLTFHLPGSSVQIVRSTSFLFFPRRPSCCSPPEPNFHLRRAFCNGVGSSSDTTTLIEALDTSLSAMASGKIGLDCSGRFCYGRQSARWLSGLTGRMPYRPVSRTWDTVRGTPIRPRMLATHPIGGLVLPNSELNRILEIDGALGTYIQTVGKATGMWRFLLRTQWGMHRSRPARAALLYLCRLSSAPHRCAAARFSCGAVHTALLEHADTSEVSPLLP
jgi:hypothetical protein